MAHIPTTPWTATPNGTILDNDGDIIAEIGGRTVAESQARALAMAAAPDLLEAAKSFVLWIDKYGDQLDPNVVGAMDCAFGGKLRNALLKTEAKARGETE